MQARKNREEAKAVQQQWGEEEAVLTERGRWVASKYSIRMFPESGLTSLSTSRRGGRQTILWGDYPYWGKPEICKTKSMACLSVFHDRQEKRRTEALEQTLLELTGEVDNYK